MKVLSIPCYDGSTSLRIHAIQFNQLDHRPDDIIIRKVERRVVDLESDYIIDHAPEARDEHADARPSTQS